MAEIASAAGVARQTAHARFGTREAMYRYRYTGLRMLINSN